MKVGVYIGSFDPVHLGHVKVMQYLIENQYVDQILVVATGSYWDKVVPTKKQDKLAMLKMYASDKIEIDEVCNDDPYTYQVLDHIQKVYGYQDLALIVSADLFLTLDRFKRVEDILKYEILVMPRDEIDIFSYASKFFLPHYFTLVPDFEPIAISSTQLRSWIQEEKWDALIPYMKEEEITYIKKLQLYRS